MHALLLLVPVAVANLTRLGIGGGLPLTYDQFDIIKLFIMRAATIVGLAGWLVSLLLRGGRVRFTKVDWLVLAFLVWVGITTLTSVHWPTALFGKYRRFEGFLSFLNYAAVYFLVVQLVDRPSRMRSLLRTLFFSGSFVVFYGALQYIGIKLIPYRQLPFEANRSFSTYGNPDLLGGFLMFILPISFALAFSEQRTGWRTFYLFGGVLSTVVWITAFTRSAWIGGSVAIVVLIVAAFRNKIKLRTEDWVMAGVSAFLGIVIVIRSLSATSEVMNVFARVRSIFEFGEGSAQTRFQIWSAAWEAIKDRPIFGFGADTFRLVFPHYKPAEYVAVAGYISVADNVHNYPLQLASAIGIPGFLLLYALFGWILWATFRHAIGEKGGASRIVYAGVWAAALGYIVHLMFGLSVTGTTVLLWAFFGLLLAPLAQALEVRAPSSTWGGIGSVLILVVAAALFFGNVNYVRADRYYMLARIGTQSGAERIAATQKAVELNPYNDMYRSEEGLAYMDAGIKLLGGQSGDPQASAAEGLRMLERAESAFRETIEFVPREYDNYVFLANLYNLMGAYVDDKYFEQAAEVARKGIEVERYGPAIRLEYARALSSTGQTGEAIKELEYAVELDPAFANGALMLAELYAAEGQFDKALEVLRAAKARSTEPRIDAAIGRFEESATAD
jgi:O-antigen ligase/Flp pilus assembly protein TadD